jgi:integrase
METRLMPGPIPSVWWRKSDGYWYTTIRGKQHRLTKGQNTKTQAQKKLRELLEKPATPEAASAETVTEMFAEYQEYVETGSGAGKARVLDVKMALTAFIVPYGEIQLIEVRPAHAREWLAGHAKWSPSTKTMRLAAVRAAFNWAVRMGKLAQQPFAKVHGPGYSRREHLPTDADLSAIMSYANESYRDFCGALIGTGCRPSEVARVEARDVDLVRQCWTMTRHKNAKKKPSPRVVWLSDDMLAMTKRLVKRYPTGPIFRNSRGRPWVAAAVVKMFKAIRKECSLDSQVTAYTLRHEYITRSLSKGTDAMTVAAMCGTSVQMLSKHYSHLMQIPAHMLAAVERTKR